jgi:hypothetical protein
MAKGFGVGNDVLLAAGLDLMKQNGKPLTKQSGSGRAMIYAMPNGETVRVRTSKDRTLIVTADKPSPHDAKLGIEGTEWLLIVMLEVAFTPGKVEAYLVPTAVAVAAARAEQQAWLDSQPNTAGKNTAWALYFDGKQPATGTDFKDAWNAYRLSGDALIAPDGTLVQTPTTSGVGQTVSVGEVGIIQAEVAIARQRIATSAGVSPAAVRITIDFGG